MNLVCTFHSSSGDIDAESADDTAGSVRVSVDQEHYCSEVAKVVCLNVLECCTSALVEQRFGSAFESERSQCLHDAELMCKQANPALVKCLGDGTVTVDEEMATLCLKGLRVEDECFLPSAPILSLEQCETELFHGTRAVGQNCSYNIQCIGSAQCGLDQICQGLPEDGQSCTASGDTPCNTGLYCDGTAVCKPLRAVGEQCNSVDRCANNLYCTGGEGSEFVCWPQQPVGELCTSALECTSGVCSPGLCADGSHCFVHSDCVGKCPGDGEECSSNDDCAGMCKESGDPCLADWDCFGVDDECEHPQCNSQCLGTPVCSLSEQDFNYCDAGLALIEGIR